MHNILNLKQKIYLQFAALNEKIIIDVLLSFPHVTFQHFCTVHKVFKAPTKTCS